MLLRHTGTQLLCPACGVALGCLWAPSALLLCGTALQPCALQRFFFFQRRLPFYMEALFARGQGAYIISSDKKNDLEPYQFRVITATGK